LQIRVVDKAGEPVPDASVWYNNFADHSSLDHQPVQVSFNKKTDDNGIVLWKNAPREGLKFHVTSPRHMRAVDVVAKKEQNELLVKLSPMLLIHGRVTDAKNNKPVERFRIISGTPRGDEIHWSSIDRFWLDFHGGTFEHVFTEGVIQGYTDYIFKVQAEGYAPFTTRIVRAEEEKAWLEIALEPSSERALTILQPDGRAANGAQVVLTHPGSRIPVEETGFLRGELANKSEPYRVADAAGKCSLNLDLPDMDRLIVVHESGALEIHRSEVPEHGTLRLMPWANLEVTVYRKGTPAPNQEFLLQHGTAQPNRLLRLDYSFSAFRKTSDEAGKIHYRRVFPGKHHVARVNRVGNGYQWSHEKAAEVDLRPGETTQLDIGRGGVMVVGTVRRAGAEPAASRLVGSIHTAMPQPPKEIVGNPAAVQQWMQSSQVKTLRAQFKSFGLTFEGSEFFADAVDPGDYQLTISALSPGEPSVPQAMSRRHVRVQSGENQLDLGEILLSPITAEGVQ
jgi:hypothetical protein